MLRNSPRGTLDSTDVGHRPGTDSLHFCRRVDTNEDHVCFGNRAHDIGRENEVGLPGFQLDRPREARQRYSGINRAISRDADNLQQTVLVDR